MGEAEAIELSGSFFHAWNFEMAWKEFGGSALVLGGLSGLRYLLLWLRPASRGESTYLVLVLQQLRKILDPVFSLMRLDYLRRPISIP
jgi:hypothetical protein